MTRAEKVAEIKRLRLMGLSRASTAANLGMSISGVDNLINDPDGSKQRARRSRYGGVCQTCGAKTDGSNGRRQAPLFCVACASDAHRTWRRENITAEIRRFVIKHGRTPHASEWTGPRSSGYPSASTVQEVFGSWANGIEAAGFARPRVGHYDRQKRSAQVAA